MIGKILIDHAPSEQEQLADVVLKNFSKLDPPFTLKPVVEKTLKDSDAPDGMLELMELMQ